MCDEVCSCHEMDECKCPNFKFDLRKMIRTLIDINSKFKYKFSIIEYLSITKFMLITNRDIEDYIQKHEEIKIELINLGYKFISDDNNYPNSIYSDFYSE